MIGRLLEVMVDCADAPALGRFWQAVLGGELTVHDDRFATLEAPVLRIGFQTVPEPKVVKNRVHLDVQVDDAERATAVAEALGARRVGALLVEGADAFQVMLDPEGNEFCLCVPGPPAGGGWMPRR